MATTLNLNDQLAVTIAALGLIFLLINILRVKKRKPEFLASPGKEAVETLVHVSSEQGKRLVLGLGHSLTSSGVGLSGASGLSLQKALLKRSLFSNHPLQSFAGDGSLACLSRMIVQDAYRGAVASELFRGSISQLGGVTSVTAVTNLTNHISDGDNAGLLLAGQFSPALVLLLDQADRHDLPVITIVSSLSGQAAGFFGKSTNLIGEDVFDASGRLNRSKAALASLSAADWLRIAISVGLILGAILRMGGSLP